MSRLLLAVALAFILVACKTARTSSSVPPPMPPTGQVQSFIAPLFVHHTNSVGPPITNHWEIGFCAPVTTNTYAWLVIQYSTNMQSWTDISTNPNTDQHVSCAPNLRVQTSSYPSLGVTLTNDHGFYRAKWQ